mmetsp:Transcript_33500/g.48584  ORF Transcript_33500/g.48584 Transcript_33500/m.48584 type:complete len:237 (-) Transcript_33500:121-831(-)
MHMCEIFFEKFNADGVAISPTGSLSLYASGKTTGLVLEIGDGVTFSMPVFKGYGIKTATFELDMAGSELTTYLSNLLSAKGTTISDMAVVRDLKEKLATDSSFTLPDGSVLPINAELTKCSEALFNPSLIGKSCQGIHQLVSKSLDSVNPEIRKDMYSNLVVSGGSCFLPGLADRLKQTLAAPSSATVNISTNTSKHAAFYGGSILCCLSSFETSWIRKDEFEEIGSAILEKKRLF